jgi:cell division protein DivIC
VIPENIKQNKWFKISTNIYVLVSLFFIFWMLFFDTNSLRIFWSLNKKIDDLEGQKKELLRQINDDKLFIQKLSDSLELEKFGRENYFLKKEDEDIYIIEFSDSLKTTS